MTITSTGGHVAITPSVSTRLALTENQRLVDLLSSLDDTDWHRSTDCPAWDVRAVAGHILGMKESFSSLRRFIADFRAASAAAGPDLPIIDALTGLQVRRNAHLSTRELVEQIDLVGPRQARWRARRRLMRLMPVKNEMPDGSVETWRLGYLVDIILNRDPWMHRVDIARAVDRPLVLTPDHDGRIVDDVVAEWARRHGQPFSLTLTGVAGGHWTRGSEGIALELDAVEFCRILSGRAPGDGLLAVPVPF